MMEDQADRAPDLVDRPTVQANRPGDEADRLGDPANRPLSRNGVETIFPNRICITLVFFLLVVVPALYLELVTLITGGEYVKQLFLAPMRLMAQLKVLEYLMELYNAIKFVKDADEVLRWLVDRAWPLLRAAAQRFTNAF